MIAVVIRMIAGAQARWLGCSPDSVQRIYFANHSSHLDFPVIWASLPDSLRAKLSARVRPTKPKLRAPRVARWAAILAPGLAALLLTGYALRGFYAPNQTLISEAVNDHLRVLYAEPD